MTDIYLLVLCAVLSFQLARHHKFATPSTKLPSCTAVAPKQPCIWRGTPTKQEIKRWEGK